MQSLVNLNMEDFKALMGNVNANTIQTAATGGTIEPEKRYGTVLIGLGGNGVKTIDAVKGVISAKLDTTWSRYIKFLGIDTDATEFSSVRYLDRANETAVTTVSNLPGASQNPNSWPRAWFPIVRPSEAVRVPEDMNDNGAKQTRLVGRLKMHDKSYAEALAVDEKIINKLTEIKASFTTAGVSAYQIFVIGSVHGGTGSGGFLEMPALIRAAFGDLNVKIHAMLFLPDTMALKYPNDAQKFYANGYASLKELNYFQGISMRPGYSETWHTNSVGHSSISFSSDVYSLPFLIGAPNGPQIGADETAREKIAEFLISILGELKLTGTVPQMLDSFKSNVDAHKNNDKMANGRDSRNLYKPAEGWRHEFPRCYCSLGVTKFAAPQNIIRAYVATVACNNAGLVSVDAEERASLVALAAADDDAVLPFRAVNDYDRADNGNIEARKMTATIEEYLHGGYMSDSRYELRSSDQYNFRYIRGKSTDNCDINTANFVQAKENDANDKLRRELGEKWQALREQIKEYVKKEGPFALYNLYYGNFSQVGTAEEAVGVRTRLTRLAEDHDAETGSEYPRKLAETRREELKNAKKLINTAALTTLPNRRSQLASDWVTKFKALTDEQVDAKYRAKLFHQGGLIETEIVKKADELVRAILCFGRIVDAAAKTYAAYADKLESPANFTDIRDSAAEIDFASVDGKLYNWVSEKAKTATAAIVGKTIRNDMIDSFFNDPKSWLEYSSELEVNDDGTAQLISPDIPVPARAKFDSCLSTALTAGVSLPVDAMFDELAKKYNVSQTTLAESIMKKLLAGSKALYNGPQAMNENIYLVCPTSFSTLTYKSILKSFQNAATSAGVPSLTIAYSAYVDGIMLYRFAAPFELYQLTDLPAWQNYYEATFTSSLCHGMSPSVKDTGDGSYEEALSWANYPSITRNEPSEEKTEGKALPMLRETIALAKKFGVLYSRKDNSGKFLCSRVYFPDRAGWKFNLNRVETDEDGRLDYSTLADSFIKANGANKISLSKDVLLTDGGVYSEAVDTEDRAWENAEKVLRVHIPMLIEIREMIDFLKPFARRIDEENAIIDEENQRLERDKFPVKVMRLIEAGILYKNDENIWMLKAMKDNVADEKIARFGDVASIRRRYPDEAGPYEAGLKFYLLKKCVEDTMSDKMATYQAAAKQTMRELDDDALEEYGTYAKEFLEEIQTAEDLGADFDNPNNISKTYKDKMAEFDISDTTQLLDIASTYRALKKGYKL